MITQDDVARVAAASSALPAATGNYIETDFILNLLETVLDYQMNTKVVVTALERFNANRWSEIRRLDDLESVLVRFADDKEGNTELAQYLWGYNLWTRAQQLRGLADLLRTVGATDQDSLRAWAARSDFKLDFEGRVKGLGIAVYQWLVMRQGVDTVKPDVHVRRFAEASVGRPLNDFDVVEVVTEAAKQLGLKAYELDWGIWEHSRGGGLPYPSNPDSDG